MRLAILAAMTGIAAITAACTPTENGGEEVVSAPATVAAPAPAPSPVPAPAPTQVAVPAPAPVPAPVAAAPTVDLAKGRALFNDWSCGACHALADAGASGSIGPALDRNTRLTREFTLATITNGQGAMPAFGGQLTDDEIAVVADYIIAAKK